MKGTCRTHLPALFLAAALMPAACLAQQGLSFAPVQWDHVFNVYDPTPLYYVLAYDDDLGPGSAQRVELSLQWTSFFKQFEQGEQLSYNGWDAYMRYEAAFTYTLTYHSLWFPNGYNEGFYLGSSIGIRHSMARLSIPDPGNYYATPSTPQPFDPTYRGTLFMVPVGLRLGIREELADVYKNFYVGVGYQLGSNGTMFPQPELSGMLQQPAGFTCSVGYAFGIGL